VTHSLNVEARKACLGDVESFTSNTVSGNVALRACVALTVQTAQFGQEQSLSRAADLVWNRSSKDVMKLFAIVLDTEDDEAANFATKLK
jgi:hypothetical protein